VKRILKIIGLIVLALIILMGLAFLVLRPKPLKTPASVMDVAELETFLDELAGHNADSPPGLSLVVVKGEEIVYQKGFGLADGPRNQAATPDTVYNYWSMTKPFTAMAILQLYEGGHLDLDAPVTDYLSFFKVQYPSDNSQVITVRHLLNHSSGLSNNVPEVVGWVHTDGGKDWNQTELIRNRLPDYAKLAYEPGSEGRYTNVGYMLLAALIEAVSEQSYEDYVRAKILLPLGMSRTDFVYTQAMMEDEATAAHPRLDFQAVLLPLLVDDVDSLVREKRDGMLWFNHVYSDQNGPTGLIGPATDMACFLMAYLKGGELDGQRVLAEETVELMTSDAHIAAGKTPEASAYDEVDHGLSWFVVPQGDSFYLAHNGGGPGFATGMRLYPDHDLGMVIMANGTYLDTIGILDLVASLDW
jgi:CubicO group peptidase (beta-lactamase class C family)